MSMTKSLALAGVVLLGLGSSVIAATSHSKALNRMHVHKQQQHEPRAMFQGQTPNRECVNDDGGGRIRPCSASGGGGGGGGM
jgi:hypothetical protein